MMSSGFFSVAAELGLIYIQNFLLMVTNRMVNPFLLHELAYECGKFYANQINPLSANVNGGNGAGNPSAGVMHQPHLPMNLMHHPMVPNVGANSNSANDVGGSRNNQHHQRLPVQSQQPAHEVVVEQIRNNIQLKQLLGKCYLQYYECMRHRLYHLAPADYDEFVSLLTYAKTCFLWTSEGPIYWSQLMKEISKSKACKKDLRQKIAPLCTSNSTSSAPISLANVNPPNATGTVATLSTGVQGAVGNAGNLQHPPPAI